MSSSSEEPRKRRVKTGKKSVLCSTPLRQACKLSSPSASTIHTNSTSSIVIRRRLRQRVKTEKKQKLAKAEKERKPAKANKEQKKKRRKARTIHNKTKPEMSIDLDDWLTVEEQSDDEKENLKQSARSLTKVTASPERMREAQHFHDFLFDSPIRQRRPDDASPVPVHLGYEKPLPLGNLSHLRTRFDSSDEEEDEKLYFKRSSPVKTYPDMRDRQKRKREISINKSKQWLIDLKVPTSAADMLWDQYVREHPEEMREYIAPPAKRREEQNKQNTSDRGKATEKDNIENWSIKKLWFGPDEPRDKVRTYEHFDTTTRKWSQIVSFPERKVSKFPVSEAGAPRMRLTEYPKKCTARKDLDSQAAGPSCLTNEQITDENVKNAKIEQRKKLDRTKPVVKKTTFYGLKANANPNVYNFPEPKDPEFEVSKPGAPRMRLNKYLAKCRARKALDSQAASTTCSRNEQITVDLDDSSSDSELELVTELQRFKNRQNEREMLSNVEKSLVPAKRIQQKRASESSKHDSKRAKIANESNKPVIRSVEKLVNKRYIKEKGYWRIV